MGTPTFPTGTKTLFFQATAPVGWVQDTSDTDYTIRIINTSGTTGGTITGTAGFSTVMVNTSVPFGASLGTAANSGTNSTAAIGPHTHSFAPTAIIGPNPPTAPYPTTTAWFLSSGTPSTGRIYTTLTGGTAGTVGTGGTHTHPISHPTSTTGTATPVNFAVQYLDHISCSIL